MLNHLSCCCSMSFRSLCLDRQRRTPPDGNNSQRSHFLILFGRNQLDPMIPSRARQMFNKHHPNYCTLPADVNKDLESDLPVNSWQIKRLSGDLSESRIYVSFRQKTFASIRILSLDVTSHVRSRMNIPRSKNKVPVHE